MTITGTITFLEIEGGFWGIKGDDQVPYQPVNELPTDIKRDGLRVKATFKPSNQMSAFQWGRIVKVMVIEELSPVE